MKPVIIIATAFVLLISVGMAHAEPDIDKKSIFNDKKFDTTTKLTNHNGIPFYFEFDRSFSESENDAYYELYKIIDSRNNQHVGDLRIYLGSSQWWNVNAFLQEKDTSGFSNIIKIKLFVIHMTDPAKIQDVTNSLSYALKTLVPEWSEKTSSVSSDEWFSDSINNAERNDENKREDSIIIEDKEITVFHDDVDFGSITIIVTENLDVTYLNYVSENNEFLEEILDLPESEPEPELEQMVCIALYDPVCGISGKTFSNMCVLESADGIFDYKGECVGTEPELKRKILCGDGTIDIDGICQVAPIEEEKPVEKSVNWFSSLFDWFGSLFG